MFATAAVENLPASPQQLDTYCTVRMSSLFSSYTLLFAWVALQTSD